ncbi:MAG: glycine cleavage system aminomethyltransferase GcvT [Desulfatiglandaceae bacterium]|jgi:aminomethyltransferase
MAGVMKTVFSDEHKTLGAKMVDFGGWEMPIQYPSGIVTEHLETRKGAGIFDVSHMGRFRVRGSRACEFLQHVLTNNAEALDPLGVGSHYTLIPNETGGAVDDAYLYRFDEKEYILVVNASNREKDWAYLQGLAKGFEDLQLMDATEDMAMVALQGPRSREILLELTESGRFPDPVRNGVGIVTIAGFEARVARTGYTGEPLCFELFVERDHGIKLWRLLQEKGAVPIGLGARDTLRLEAGLPLYGHELGEDPDGEEIPILAVPITKIAVSFSPLKGAYVGREALAGQFEDLAKISRRDFSGLTRLPRMVQPVALTGRGIARAGAKVFRNARHVGYVTSGTMVPYWVFEGEGLESVRTDGHGMRAIGLAYVDNDIIEGDGLEIEVRGKRIHAVVVPFHMRSEAPPFARPIVVEGEETSVEAEGTSEAKGPLALLKKAAENTEWRQRECINLIPSEMTISPMARLLSIMDPAFRYAEHRDSKAFHDAEIFYYQGTAFIEEVEQHLEQEMRKFLGCEEVETRLISGQMANAAVFSAVVDYLNRTDRRSEPRRIRRVMNNYLGKGGHLSAQPMGALRDFVARDPQTERPAVVNFPVLRENPYKMDLPATLDLIDQTRPELIILGKSMVLHREPVREIRQFLDDQKINAILMYDMAHVLGLVGSHFQKPFEEGADLVTGSTHKTFFGTQRGVAGSRFQEEEERYELWEALRRRTFPGSVSNHHLGTMLGLLMAAYEMNHFKDDYQSRVIANAKTFAHALSDRGLEVAGDPAIDFTETHQVVVRVGYARGPEIARRLEANHIICNYQTAPDEEGFTAAGALRTGVSEMTRFGMREGDFQTLANLMGDVIEDGLQVSDQVRKLRQRFQDLQFCFKGDEYREVLQELHGLL